MSDYYDRWIDRQAEHVEAAMREAGRSNPFADLAVYVIPSRPGAPGRLVAATQKPDGATDVVRIGPHGTTVMRCPYPHLRGLLWNACRSFPILPMEG